MSQAVFFSTGGLNQGIAEAVSLLVDKEGISNVELSAGPYDPAGIEWLKAQGRGYSLQLHNYFPVPYEPFVLNLASTDPLIRKRSIDLALAAIELTDLVGATRYSVHAGFCADPKPWQLGRRWAGLDRVREDVALDYYAQSVQILAGVARERGVSLLVENNVLLPSVASELGDDVLLMASADQMLSAKECFPSDVSLLLDVGHLKVSCQTLGLDPCREIQRLSTFTGGYHLSDNDGLGDQNRLVTRQSWFWRFMSKDVDFATLEVEARPGEAAEQVALVQELWGSDVASQ